MAFFSIVIPLFNKENFISNTLQSVFNQSFTDYEIIIVDDCSTDNSLKIVVENSSDKVKIVRHEINKGLSATRNTGIKNATAKHIIFLDADDLWKPTYLEKINTLILKFPEANLFATNYAELYPNNIEIPPTTNLKNFENDGIIPTFFESNLSQPIYCYSSLCVEKRVFEKIGFFDERITFGEDIDFSIRANANFKLAYSRENLVTYLMFSENRMSKDTIQDKEITDFDGYEILAKTTPSLKKFLDFNRYVMYKHYKIEGNKLKMQKMKSGIHPNPMISGLNFKQRLLMKLPLFFTLGLVRLKYLLVKRGIRLTTFGSRK